MTLVLSTAFALVLADFGVGMYSRYLQSKDQIDPGFLVYDSEVGWRMARSWKGRHRHYDFDVEYTTNAEGLRGDWPARRAGSTARRYALLGDSFTFGLGVNDNETFTAELSRRNPEKVHLNAGVAGYSTDQEYLFLKKHLGDWQVDGVILVVYLANDLLDNTLNFPLQASMGKPFFEWDVSTGLQVRNQPVPQQPKSPVEMTRSLGRMVLGEEIADRRASSWRSQWHIARRLGLAETTAASDLEQFPQRLAYPIDLFTQLVREMRVLCEQNGVSLTLVLMPGRSYVETPRTLSGEFQDYLRREILARASEFDLPVIDLASRLQQRYNEVQRPLFHPHEGHLNAFGNATAAELLHGVLPK
jgi:hypothetical protein